MKTSGLRDYSADARIVYVSALAAGLGAACAVVAWALLELIRLSTNLFYIHHWTLAEHDPWDAGRHWWMIFMPVLGGLLVGVIARYLSPRVRGHGMPEAIETIAFGGGKVQPRVAVLKPLATAISIGSGGPFGAEGPVIITGGAVGSVLGQLLPMTDSERTVMMVAGASAGMAATFNCPFAATLLAVEILLFEWKPRSLVPVAIACVTAGAVRRLLLGPGSLLQMDPRPEPLHHQVMLGALVVGIVAAFFALFLGRAIKFSEAMFHKLPIHWMWWPAIGGLGVGVGGWFFPQSLGVGYSVLQNMITNGRHTAWYLLIGVLTIKTLIWIFALGSETAGGILAPLLLIGGAMGAALGHVMPQLGPGSWVMVGMTSLLTAAIGCPLTSAMLALELTHNGNLMMPVLLACMVAYAISALVQPRSLLTEKLSSRGLHLSRELGVDPLETMLVGEAMHTSVFALPDSATAHDAAGWLHSMEERGPEAWSGWQRIFPLLYTDGRLAGLLTRTQMMAAAREAQPERRLLVDAHVRPLTVRPDQTLRVCAVQMAESKLTSFPVVDELGKLVGVVTVDDLLKGRDREARRDGTRVRVLRPRWPFGHRAAAGLSRVETPATVVSTPATDFPDPESPAAKAAAEDHDEQETLAPR